MNSKLFSLALSFIAFLSIIGAMWVAMLVPDVSYDSIFIPCIIFFFIGAGAGINSIDKKNGN